MIMKHTLTILLLAALAALSAALADDLTVTLTAPLTVKTVQVVEAPATQLTVEQIIIDPIQNEIGVKLAGVEARQVINGVSYEEIKAQFLSAFQAALSAALDAQAQPSPSPTP